MSTPAITTDDASGVLQLSGDMVLASVQELLEQTKTLLASEQYRVIDLSGVTGVDSSGVALMLEWVEWAREHGASLQFRNIPESLMRIARLSRVEALLTDGFV
jgi:phospholipid transport system transporter-binding protein